MDIQGQRKNARAFTRVILRPTIILKQTITIGRIILVAAMILAAAACSKSRAELEQEYIGACIMLGEYEQSICECAASKAGNELSPESLELLVVTTQGNEKRAARLRDRAGIVEVMEAGTFAIDGPARCLREADAQ